MALKPLQPAPKESLGHGWELVASEAGRSHHGLCATIALFNGIPRDLQTLALGDEAAQQALVTKFATVAAVDSADMRTAFMKLAVAVEGALRQLADQGDVHDSQATRLITLALDAGAELFHTPDGDAYATIAVAGHKETWPLKVKGFRRWLTRLFYQTEAKSPGSQAVQDALGVLEGKALFDGGECPVATRLAEHNGAIYLDLANDQWQTVEITTTGWQVIAEPPVKFRRPRGMVPLPVPLQGHSLEALRPFVNIATDADWRLLVSWLVAALRPTGPYPVLVVHGEQGSAKSSLSRVLRSLVDPNSAALRTTPRDERDLVITANNGWLIALDNLSHLPEWLSDALCRLATGSGFATRELYSDAEEVIFAAQRPIVLNGIEELATRPDLLDRAILLYLPTIPEHKRQDETVFWQQFAQAQPQILGALLDAVSAAVRTLPGVRLDRKPRMADFALWACAAAPACGWTAQDVLMAYAGVRDAAHELTLEASPVGSIVRALAEQQDNWCGTASELLTALDALAGEKIPKQKTWPKNGRALGNLLRRLAPTLRAVGIDVVFDRESDKARRRIIHLTLVPSHSAEGHAAVSPEDASPTEEERAVDMF
jgi:hypothetical protein